MMAVSFTGVEDQLEYPAGKVPVQSSKLGFNEYDWDAMAVSADFWAAETA
jgi:hypothetical protein